MKSLPRCLFLFLFAWLFVSSASAYYDPRLGRWLSRDPLGEAGGFNLYAYCGNDPVNRHDPLGLSDWLEMKVIGDGTGLFAAMLSYVDDNVGPGHSTPQFVGALRRDGWVELENGRITSLSAILEEVNSIPTNFKGFSTGKNTFPNSALTTGSWDPSGLRGALTYNGIGLAKFDGTVVNGSGSAFSPERWDEIRNGTNAAASMVQMGMFQYIPGLAALPSLRAPITLSGLKSVESAKSLRFLSSRSPATHQIPRQALALPVPKMVLHHIFNKFRGASSASQKYRNFFKKHGIEVDKHAVEMTDTFHKAFIHRGGNNWTTRWKTWIDANEGATTMEVYQFAGRLMDEYGINHLPIVPYK
jgi:hypothetical protein